MRRDSRDYRTLAALLLCESGRVSDPRIKVEPVPIADVLDRKPRHFAGTAIPLTRKQVDQILDEYFG